MNHAAAIEPARVRRDYVSGTVLRALAVLDVLVAEPRGLGLTAATKRAGLDKATTYRLLSALERGGLAIRDRNTGAYRPAMKLVRMAEQVLQALDFRTVARPYMDRLARAVGHGVLAGILEGDHVVLVDYVEGGQVLRVHQYVGERSPINCSATAKAIVSQLPPAEAEPIVDACEFERRTEHTIVDRQVLLAQFEEARQRGWALARDESTIGVSSVAAPVFDYSDRVVGALVISAPSFALRGTGLDRCVCALLETCHELSEELGHEHPSQTGASGASRI